LGTCGFVGGLARPGSYYGYSLLSKQANADRLTTYVFRCIVRLGHYLVRTKALHLHLTTPQLVRRAGGATTLDLFSCFVDSSHGNGEDGASHGGFLIASRAPPPAQLLAPTPTGPAPVAVHRERQALADASRRRGRRRRREGGRRRPLEPPLE
jgi:hypothetical protein